METTKKTIITVETNVRAPLEKVWRLWTSAEHITKWCNASEDWHAPYAENDLRVDGKFKTTMAAKDGSVSFDFEGIYTIVQTHKLIEYTISDGRKVKIIFTAEGGQIKVTEIFEAENIHPIEVQKGGWQSILDSFKKYTETNN